MATVEPTYPLAMPSSPGFTTSTFGLRNAIAETRSPFTFDRQVQRHQGQIWFAQVALPQMHRAQAEEWLTFLVNLQGKFGTFLLGDPDAKTPRGTNVGTPVVNGASQTGNTLVTDGWGVSQTVLEKGDYFATSTNTLHKLTAAAVSDGSGNATLTFEPRIRSALSDNAPLTTSNAQGRFQLVSNDVSWTANQLSTYGVSFDAIGVIV